MKRFPLMLIMSFALALGCEQEATDVDTTAPPDDEPSAVTGYRGELEDDTEQPDGATVVQPESDVTPPPEDRTTQPTLGDQQQATQPPSQPQPTQEPTEPVDEEPAVEEVPAESLPADAETGDPQQD